MGWESFPAANVSKLQHKLYGSHVQDISAKLIAQGGLTIMSMTQYGCFFLIFITTPEGHVGVHFGDIIISIQSGTENRLIILLVLALVFPCIRAIATHCLLVVFF